MGLYMIKKKESNIWSLTTHELFDTINYGRILMVGDK